MASSHVVASHITKLLSSFRQIVQFRFRENRQGRIPPWKVTKTRPFMSTCYGYPSTTEVPPCCQAATKKLTFSTTSVLLLLNVPLSLSRGTVFRRQKNPRRGYRPKIAGILFVCNEPEGKYYTVPNTKQQPKLWHPRHRATWKIGLSSWASTNALNVLNRIAYIISYIMVLIIINMLDFGSTNSWLNIWFRKRNRYAEIRVLRPAHKCGAA